MMLRLDPAIACVWRTPTALQFGVDPVRAVIEVDPDDERLIEALERGTTRRLLDLLAEPPRAAGVLAQVGALLQADAGAPPRPEARIRSARREEVRALLAGLLPPGPVVDDAPGLLVVDHVVAPAEHLGWLREDRAHLAVVFGERSATIGPLVRPGETGCLRCRDLHRRDADPAWPAIATQLLERPAAAAADPALRAEALALGVAALRRGHGPGAGTALRIDLDGTRAETAADPHPDCGCLGL